MSLTKEECKMGLTEESKRGGCLVAAAMALMCLAAALVAEVYLGGCRGRSHRRMRLLRRIRGVIHMPTNDEMEEFGNLPVKHPGIRVLHNDDFSRELGYARRIREALGVES